MKYLLFNGVVAAALIYLVAGDKLELTNPFENGETAQNEISQTVTGDAKVAYQQTVMQTATKVAAITAERIATEVTTKLLLGKENAKIAEETDAVKPLVENTPIESMTDEALPPLQEEVIEVTPDYVIDEASAVAASRSNEISEPIIADTSTPVTQPAIQLAGDAQFMSSRDRQKELDTLAQNMEFLFLSTQ